jgi:hypothetical protein
MPSIERHQREKANIATAAAAVIQNRVRRRNRILQFHPPQAGGYTLDMGLFQKRNKDVTPLKAVVAALAGAPLGVAALSLWQWLFVEADQQMRTAGFYIWAAVCGAIVTAAIYWNGWPD